MRKKILWLIGSKNLKVGWQKWRKRVKKPKVSTSGEDSDSLSTDSSSPAKKKKKAKRRWHHQPTSPSSSTASDSSTNEESHNEKNENEKLKLKLPKSLAHYANLYFEQYIVEDSLKEVILCQNPVPDNLDNFKKLRNILKGRRKTNKQNNESVFEMLQWKTVYVVGPLLKLWNILAGAKGWEDKAVQISINDLLHYVEQIPLLLGQSNNKITYHE